MISISQNMGIYSYKNLPLKTFRGSDVSDLILGGDKFLNENKFNEALNYYQQAQKGNPEEINVYKKIAKAQFGLKNFSEAEKNYKLYLEENPKDVDIIIELGETLRQSGHYKDAINTFEKAYQLDKSNDLARRSILMTKNDMLAVYSPKRASKEKAEYAAENLKQAMELTSQYMTPKYMKELNNVKFQFGKTASMGGTGNIAQYENSKKTITVADSYIYAAPQVIAAYLSHESVHAHDNDAYTSVKEEQDAYEIATKFWIKNSNGISDPEMDYAAELFKQSPEKLSKRVEEIYTLRDPSIAKTSPNHPPQKIFHWTTTQKNESASQSIKTYDVIA